MSNLVELAQTAAPRLSVAELHGATCGLLVGGRIADQVPIEQFPMAELVDLAGSDYVTDAESLEDFVRAATEQLRSADLSFQPLLSETLVEIGADHDNSGNDPIDIRVVALAEWCEAFTAALGTQLSQPQAEIEEVAEIIEDFVAITQVDAAVEGFKADPEGAEKNLSELEEYVKVGTLLLTDLLK